MKKGIIFDLDMCILDTHSLTGPFFDPVIRVLYQSRLPDDRKKAIEAQLWTTSLDDTVAIYHVPPDIVQEMRAAYQFIEVPEGIYSYGDEACIRDLPVGKYLVTSGYRNFQETKIAKLGIADLFDGIIIDATDDPRARKGKRQIFIDIMAQNGWGVGDVLVVGDNPKSELGIAKELGITTVQTLRPTVTKWDEADHHITSLSELKALLLPSE